MYRIALIRPLYEGDEDEFQEPLGLELITAELRKSGFDVKIFDRRLYFLLSKDFWADLKEYNPDLVGFSLMTVEDSPDAMRVLYRIRSLYPDIPSVIGGLYVTTNTDQARARFPSNIFLITGEGEKPMARLCLALRDGLEVPDLSSEPVDPNEWCDAARDNLSDYEKFGAPINIKASRGCPGKCTFCATPSLPNGYNRWMAKSLEAVAAEVQRITEKADFPVFQFVDDTFGSGERLERFCDMILERNLNIAFSLQMRTDALPSSDEQWIKFKKAGLFRIFSGIENFDVDTLQKWNKRIDPEKALECLKSAKKAGIYTRTGYILWHNGSRLETIKQQAARLHDAGLFTYKTALSDLLLLSGSMLHRMSPSNSYSPFYSKIEENYFLKLKIKLQPLWNLWTGKAIMLITALGRAVLDSSGYYKNLAVTLDQQLNKIDETAYQCLMDINSINYDKIEEIAEEMGKDRRNEFCCSGDRRVGIGNIGASRSR